MKKYITSFMMFIFILSIVPSANADELSILKEELKNLKEENKILKERLSKGEDNS